MPQVAEAPATVFLHCRDPRCAGYNQEEAQGTRKEISFTFGDNGGDGIFTHFVERSMVTFHADEADIPCPACGEPREATDQHRPAYQPLSGHDPMGLLKNAKFNPSEDKTAALEARLAVMAAQIEKLTEGKDDDKEEGTN